MKDIMLKQTGDSRYFDIRLTLGEAIALVDANDQLQNLMAQYEMKRGELTNPSDLDAAIRKIFRGYQLTIQNQSNELV
jgi:hypothetical protein